MELKDFVSSTITQILVGIRDAQESDIAKKQGALIAYHVNLDKNHPDYAPVSFVSPDGKGATTMNAWMMRFDVAVTASSDSGNEGKGKLNVLNLATLGASAIDKRSQAEASRVSFGIPVVWCSSKKG